MRLEYDKYKAKPYAKDLAAFKRDITSKISVEKGMVFSPVELEGYLNPGPKVAAENILDLVDDFMPSIEGLPNQTLSPVQRSALVEAIASVWSYAYERGRRAGLEDGVFAFNKFLDFPFDLDESTVDDDFDPVLDSALAAYDDYYTFIDNKWVNLSRRYPSEGVLRFAQEHGMTWQRALYVLDAIRGKIYMCTHLSKDEQDAKELFLSLLKIFDEIEIDCYRGYQLYKDACDFFTAYEKETPLAPRWNIARDLILIDDVNAYYKKVPIDDIFAGGRIAQVYKKIDIDENADADKGYLDTDHATSISEASDSEK